MHQLYASQVRSESKDLNYTANQKLLNATISNPVCLQNKTGFNIKELTDLTATN